MARWRFLSTSLTNTTRVKHAQGFGDFYHCNIENNPNNNSRVSLLSSWPFILIHHHHHHDNIEYNCHGCHRHVVAMDVAVHGVGRIAIWSRSIVFSIGPTLLWQRLLSSRTRGLGLGHSCVALWDSGIVTTVRGRNNNNERIKTAIPTLFAPTWWSKMVAIMHLVLMDGNCGCFCYHDSTLWHLCRYIDFSQITQSSY